VCSCVRVVFHGQGSLSLFLPNSLGEARGEAWRRALAARESWVRAELEIGHGTVARTGRNGGIGAGEGEILAGGRGQEVELGLLPSGQAPSSPTERGPARL
jgi:hypothetical protein